MCASSEGLCSECWNQGSRLSMFIVMQSNFGLLLLLYVCVKHDQPHLCRRQERGLFLVHCVVMETSFSLSAIIAKSRGLCPASLY